MHSLSIMSIVIEKLFSQGNSHSSARPVATADGLILCHTSVGSGVGEILRFTHSKVCDLSEG